MTQSKKAPTKAAKKKAPARKRCKTCTELRKEIKKLKSDRRELIADLNDADDIIEPAIEFLKNIVAYIDRRDEDEAVSQ